MKRTTWILLVVALLLALFIGVYERRTLRTDEWRRDASRLVAADPDEVIAISVERDGEVLRLERDGVAWKLVAPVATEADDGRVQSVLTQLEVARIQSRLVPGEAEEDSTYGLDAPRAILRVDTGGDQETVLRFGVAAPVGEAVYVRVDGVDDVLLADRTLLAAIDHPPAAFREHRLLRFETAAAQELQLRYPDAAISLIRDEGAWTLREPAAARADRDAVRDYLFELASVRASDFVDDAPADLAVYGLVEPELEIDVGLQDDSVARLLIGSPPPEHADLRYAKAGDRPSVCTVRAADLEGLRKTAADLRERHLFSIEPDEVRRIVLTRPDGDLVLIREAGDAWSIGAGREMAGDPVVAAAFLRMLRDLAVEEFVDDAPAELAKYGLETPARTISLHRSADPDAADPGSPPDAATAAASGDVEGAPLTTIVPSGETFAEADAAASGAGGPSAGDWPMLLVGDEADDDPGLAYARRSDEAFVVAVDAGLLGILDSPVVSWRDRRLFAMSTEEIRRVIVEREGLRIEAYRDDTGAWRLPDDVEGVLDGARLALIANELAALRVAAYEASGVTDPADAGLEFPDQVITLERVPAEGDPIVYTLRIGLPGPDGQARVLWVEEGLLFRVTSETDGILAADFFRAPPRPTAPSDLAPPDPGPAVGDPPADPATAETDDAADADASGESR